MCSANRACCVLWQMRLLPGAGRGHKVARVALKYVSVLLGRPFRLVYEGIRDEAPALTREPRPTDRMKYAILEPHAGDGNAFQPREPEA